MRRVRWKHPCEMKRARLRDPGRAGLAVRVEDVARVAPRLRVGAHFLRPLQPQGRHLAQVLDVHDGEAANLLRVFDVRHALLHLHVVLFEHPLQVAVVRRHGPPAGRAEQLHRHRGADYHVRVEYHDILRRRLGVLQPAHDGGGLVVRLQRRERGSAFRDGERKKARTEYRSPVMGCTAQLGCVCVSTSTLVE